MWNFINKIFRPNEKKEWLEELFDNIEDIAKNNRHVRCRILDIKSRGFVVKVGGMYAYLSFKCMPWQYPYVRYWEAIFPALKGRIFRCCISEATRDGKKPFSIHVDASIYRLTEVELIEETQYEAIIIRKTEYGVFVEIGGHFNWRHGSMIGLLHKSYFINRTHFEQCNTGDELSVVLASINERGLEFMDARYFREMPNWSSEKMNEYIKKEAEVHVYKNRESDGVTFLIENKYPALISGLPENFVAKDSDVFLCKIFAIDLRMKAFRGFWIGPSATRRDEVNWHSDEIAAYLGKKVKLNLYKIDNRITCFVENRYKAKFDTKARPQNFDAYENRIVTCRIVGINHESRHFLVTWAEPSASDCEAIDWNAEHLAKYIGRKAAVQMFTREDGRQSFFVYGRYPARLSIKLPDEFVEGNDFVQCKIVAIDRENSCFVLRWTGVNGQYNIKWKSSRLAGYVGKECEVNVYQDEHEQLFFVENKYPARMEAIPENFRFDEKTICKVQSIDLANEQFILSWSGPTSGVKINWNAEKLKKQIGRNAPVNIYKVGEKQMFFVANRYPAHLSDEQYSRIAGNEHVYLKVMSINTEQGYFELQLLDSYLETNRLRVCGGKLIDMLDTETISRLITTVTEGKPDNVNK